MSRSNLPLLLTAMLAALALGFLARRSTSPAPLAEAPLRHLEVAPIRSITPAPSPATIRPAPAPTTEPSTLLAEALAHTDAKDQLAAASAFYRWLQAVDAAQLAQSFESPPANRFTPIEVLAQTALLRWAELDPAALLDARGDDPAIQRPLQFARLLQHGADALADCPDDLQHRIRQFLAARYPTFDLAWARSFRVSLFWFVHIWLQRGLDPVTLFADRAALDEDVVRAIFWFVSSQPGGRKVAHLSALLALLDDPALVAAAREGIRNSASHTADPLAALQILHALDIPFVGSPGPGTSGSSATYHAALSDTPQETVDWILSLDPEARKRALAGIFTSSLSGYTNTRGWLDLYLRLPPEELPHLSQLHIYLNHEMSHPHETLAWCEQMVAANQFPPGEVGDSSRTQLLSHARALGEVLAGQDPAEALARASDITDERLRQAVLGGIASALVPRDLEAARDLLPELDGHDHSRLTNEIFRREFREMPLAEALQALQNIPDPDQRFGTTQAVLFDATIPPERRAAVVDQGDENLPNLLGSSSALIMQWAQSSPAEAAAWIEQYADHSTFPRHVEDLVGRWARDDLIAAADWVVAQEPGQARDNGIRIIAAQSLERDPHAALEWAASISHPGYRNPLLSEAALAIDTHATEADEAQTAIARLDLPDQERAALLRRLAP